ncbi:MAG: hypothetical protein KDA24_01725 [Deltaproteobacteria bacterium]|nr:hypothetical protein [Deltaproteobacteria bacterium]
MSREDDRIIPGESIGPFRLGATESDVLAQIGGGSVHREQRDDTQVMHWNDLSFWFDQGQLTQIGAHTSFGGRTAAGIGVGSSLADLSKEGELGLDLEDGVIILEDVDGICFDVGDGLPEMGKMLADELVEGADGPGFHLDAAWLISWIGVFDPDRVAAIEDEEERASAEA